MRRVLSIVVVTLIFVLSGCQSQDDNVLVVGLECNYAPFNWTVSSDSETAVSIEEVNAYCDGYDVQVASYIAEELGMELQIRKIEWDGLIPALLSGEIDVIIAGMSPTPERAETVSFTNEYYRSEQVLVVSSSGDYADATLLSDFSGAAVIAQLGTLQDGLIDQIRDVNHQTALNDYPSLVASLTSGVSDAVVAELPVAQSIVSSNSGLSIVRLGDNGFTVDDSDVSVSVAVRQEDTALLADINTVLSGISEATRNLWMEEALTRQP
ncbi:MAG: transporter substrate-binding domain-containing protein [Firmicutes bacterium]|nr:transporter substrate-binding domain-containing protein [Bacillota bacterium]